MSPTHSSVKVLLSFLFLVSRSLGKGARYFVVFFLSLSMDLFDTIPPTEVKEPAQEFACDRSAAGGVAIVANRKTHHSNHRKNVSERTFLSSSKCLMRRLQVCGFSNLVMLNMLFYLGNKNLNEILYRIESYSALLKAMSALVEVAAEENTPRIFSVIMAVAATTLS